MTQGYRPGSSSSILLNLLPCLLSTEASFFFRFVCKLKAVPFTEHYRGTKWNFVLTNTSYPEVWALTLIGDVHVFSRPPSSFSARLRMRSPCFWMTASRPSLTLMPVSLWNSSYNWGKSILCRNWSIEAAPALQRQRCEVCSSKIQC